MEMPRTEKRGVGAVVFILVVRLEIIQKSTMTVVDGMLSWGMEKHVGDGALSPGNTVPTYQRMLDGMDERQAINAISRNLTASLELILHKSNTMLWDLEFINKRAGAQMTAVRPTLDPKFPCEPNTDHF